MSVRLRATHDHQAVQAELVLALLDGPGIVVLKRAFADLAVVDRVSDSPERLRQELGSGAKRRRN